MEKTPRWAHEARPAGEVGHAQTDTQERLERPR
jgi:hypothetical protein